MVGPNSFYNELPCLVLGPEFIRKVECGDILKARKGI